ncbi:MAG: hypothetical protein NZ953_02610 [Thaumarchaeota archaeon]|nr:hypothetical protein [Candidatus Calditenuaceae archaeon]MDW8042725.1 hypothetical protein [Nitrososphaerota archaeon]
MSLEHEASRRILISLLTDPHRSGRTIYFDPDALSARLGGQAWDHLEAMIELGEKGLIKFHFTKEVELLFRFIRARARLEHVAGLKEVDEVADELRKAKILGRIVGRDLEVIRDQRVPDHLEALRALSVQLGKLLKLLEGKKLVSREVYEMVAASVLSQTANVVQSTEQVLSSLRTALAELVEVMNALIQERARILGLRDRLGFNLEELDLVSNSYLSGIEEFRRLLQQIDRLLRGAIPNWDEVIGSAQKMSSEFAQRAPFVDVVLKQMTSINEMLKAGIETELGR